MTKERIILDSENCPIEVYSVAKRITGLTGILGMTVAPGVKHEYSTEIWDRDIDKDLDRLQNYYEVDLLITLLEQHEFQDLRMFDFIERLKQYDIDHIWFPIPDTSVPRNIPRFANLVTRIIDALSNGQTVVVHCMAGLGRSGLVAASCLTALGFTPAHAIAVVRSVRPGAIDPREQESFVAAFNSYLRAYAQRRS
jgi:protein-tyrosine phosphatase